MITPENADQFIARAEWAAVLFGFMQFLFNGVIGAFIWQGRRAQAALLSAHREVQALNDKLDQSDARTHEVTNKLIDERMRGFTHDVAGVISGLKFATAAHEIFVSQTQKKFEEMTNRDHESELKFVREVKETQIEIAKQSATKEDLRRHEESMRHALDDIKRLVKC